MSNSTPEQLVNSYLKRRDLSRVDLETLNTQLKASNQFAMARRVLDHAAEHPPAEAGEYFATWVQQQRALCTYKDTERPPVAALREALGILDQIGLYDSRTTDTETLGLGGSIYKRFWDHEGNVANLHSALALYRAGWERSKEIARVHCGANAACVLDRLAYIAKRAAKEVNGDTNMADRLHWEAEKLREGVLAAIPEEDGDASDEGRFWRDAKRAEALYGLGRYKESESLMRSLATQPPASWEQDTFIRQLIDIAVCRGVQLAPESQNAEERAAATALRPLLGDDLEAALGLVRGRVGLALSGGGFRAAFYHLGVLARLAEVDALRHVEVLSTVSGGSIVGAMYYLKLKALLETGEGTGGAANPDRKAYITLVAELQQQFFAGVRRNLRANTLADLWKNLRMMFTRYSRSHRIGELYEEFLYAQVDGTTRRSMDQLLIRPAGTSGSQAFKPNAMNWRRHAKVPVLLINSTTLNSGHNFQFTANWMGEPPGLVGAEIDMNARYRRVYYRDVQNERLRKFPLGYAVAASSGVPILFAPITLRGLYPDHTIELVDGGIHDNQGIGGLLDESCNFIICSDASGQMADSRAPGNGTIDVALRSSDIGQDRVRESEYADVAARERAGALRGLCYVHLKDGLTQATVDATGQAPGAPKAALPTQTAYGIDRHIQSALSEIRTDLDSFSEVEAYSLMLSGYKAISHQLAVQDQRHRRKGSPGQWGGFYIGAPVEDWPFLKLEAIARRPRNLEDAQRTDLELQLRVGSRMFLKAFCLDRCLLGVTAGWGLLLAALATYAIYISWDATLYTIKLGPLVTTVAFFGLGLLAPATRFLWPNILRRDLLLRFVIPVAIWMPTKIHLWLIEPAFQKRGQLNRLLKIPPAKT